LIVRAYARSASPVSAVAVVTVAGRIESAITQLTHLTESSRMRKFPRTPDPGEIMSHRRLSVWTSAACALVLVSTLGCARRSGGADPKPIEPTAAVTRVEELLIGKYAGVEVVKSNDGGYHVIIRGTGSGAPGGQPLWVIDGSPIEVHSTQDLAWVNPGAVVKISVLKDPADLGIYGRRGANGVIVVTTKRPGRT
jgi:TonB-dependent SusC/RagA subfamily outer membrane receptor